MKWAMFAPRVAWVSPSSSPDGKNETKGSNEVVWMYNRRVHQGKGEIIV